MTTRDRAREALASAIKARNPSMGNAALSVRAGYENIWIASAIDALELVLRLVPDEGDEDQGGRA